MLADRPGRWGCGGGGGARGVTPRAVPVAEVQAELVRQGAWLRGPEGSRRSDAAPASAFAP